MFHITDQGLFPTNRCRLQAVGEVTSLRYGCRVCDLFAVNTNWKLYQKLMHCRLRWLWILGHLRSRASKINWKSSRKICNNEND